MDSQKDVSEESLIFHCMESATVLKKLSSSQTKGLTTNDAEERLERDGENILKGDSDFSVIKVFLHSLFNSMNGILMLALILGCVVRDWFEAAIVGIIIITNTLISFVQEFKSEKTMEALRSLSSPIAKVLRDEKVTEIAASKVVKGDIVLLHEGDQVPADIRLVEIVNLEVDEAILTGENLPVIKNLEILEDSKCPLGDRKNMAFKNTHVTRGRGVGVVVYTGMETEIGKIATSVMKNTGPTQTKLQKQLRHMMYFLLLCAIIFAVVVLAVNNFNMKNYQVLLYAIAVSVAIIPEGLPAVVVVNVSLGIRQMAKERAIVRRMNALESLGEVTNICSDKTGTLTFGKMTVLKIWTLEGIYEVVGEGINPEGKVQFPKSEEVVTPSNISPSMEFLGYCASLCNTCTLENKGGKWVSTGDPTEVALLVTAFKLGLPKAQLLERFRFESEMPFDSTVKRMTAIYTDLKSNQIVFLSKGATEQILSTCTQFLNEKGLLEKIDEDLKKQVLSQMESLASEGLRILAFSYKIETELKDYTLNRRSEIESEMIFLGLVGMYDPPRPESANSVVVCHRAGITVHMATGDHLQTASSIAKQIGIIKPDENHLVMVSRDFEMMSDSDVDSMKELPRVLARCSPESKVKLIDALKRRKKFVVMTGDGVNDAPAVKKADVGIAMGLNGSDVTKQASDIVLTDDNFSTIVLAVEEGRRIFSNIGKFTLHLLTSNVAEVVCLIVGLVFMDADGNSVFSMSPIQILWLNLITSSPIAILLGFEKASPDLMKKPPRKHNEGLFGIELVTDTFFYGFIMGSASLLVFYLSVLIDPSGNGFSPLGCNTSHKNEGCFPIFQARGATFASLYLMLLIHAFNCKNTRKSLFKTNYLDNKKLTLVVFISALLIFPIIYIPVINNDIFKHDGITWHWGLVCAANIIFVISAEIYKWIKRKYF